MPFTESHQTVLVENLMVLLDLHTWIAGFEGSSVVLQFFPPTVIDQSRWPLCDLSWIFTVPPVMLPHSAPLPLTLRVPFPVASSEPQFDPQECASSGRSPQSDLGQRQTREQADAQNCKPPHMLIVGGDANSIQNPPVSLL